VSLPFARQSASTLLQSPPVFFGLLVMLMVIPFGLMAVTQPTNLSPRANTPVTPPITPPGSTPSPTPSPLPSADINNDSKVNLADYTLLSQEFMQTGPNLNSDLNNDNKVDLADYTILAQQFGIGL